MSDAPTVALVSLGCPKNLVDSEVMLARLGEAGCVVGAPMDDADVIVINTCGFIADARSESAEVIDEAIRLKQQGRVRRLVVAGCLPSLPGGLDEQLAGQIDAIIGVNDREKIVAAVCEDTPLRAIDGPIHRYDATHPGDTTRFRLTPPHTAYLRIAEGCDQRCTFCTIPLIRGPMRSKPPELVLREAGELVESGARELIVIAQDTTAWGSDLPGEPVLADLLEQLDTMAGADWIRLMYTYPMRFDDRLIDVLADSEHIVPYIDMPLQHISDAVLKRMGRRHDRAAVESLLGTLRERIAGLSLRTGFIVGFPGETDEQFNELNDFVQQVRFEHLGVFAYSPEPATPAAKLDGPVDPQVAAERADELMLAQQQIAFEHVAAQVGQPIEVLVDGVDEQGYTVGRHAGQAPDVDSVCLLSAPRPSGEIIPGVVVDGDGYDLIVQPTG